MRGPHWKHAWEATDLGKCPKREPSQKQLGEGARGLLDPVSKKLLALVRNGVAVVQKRFLVVPKTLGRPLLSRSKRPFAPSPHHFCPFSGNFPGRWLPKASSDLTPNGLKGLFVKLQDHIFIGVVAFEKHPRNAHETQARTPHPTPPQKKISLCTVTQIPILWMYQGESPPRANQAQLFSKVIRRKALISFQRFRRFW